MIDESQLLTIFWKTIQQVLFESLAILIQTVLHTMILDKKMALVEDNKERYYEMSNVWYKYSI